MQTRKFLCLRLAPRHRALDQPIGRADVGERARIEVEQLVVLRAPLLA